MRKKATIFSKSAWCFLPNRCILLFKLSFLMQIFKLGDTQQPVGRLSVQKNPSKMEHLMDAKKFSFHFLLKTSNSFC